jgi:predicted amino acid racemase
MSMKPSVPIGQIGQDAFGHLPVFEDRGFAWRAILALGRQDIESLAYALRSRGPNFGSLKRPFDS